MSEADIEMVSRSVEAWNRGDLDLASEAFHPDAEWYPYLGALEADVYRGRESIVAMWKGFKEHLSGFRLGYEEMTDLGDAIIAVVRAEGVGAESGVRVEQRWAQLFFVEAGKIARVEGYESREAALEALRRRAG